MANCAPIRHASAWPSPVVRGGRNSEMPGKPDPGGTRRAKNHCFGRNCSNLARAGIEQHGSIHTLGRNPARAEQSGRHAPVQDAHPNAFAFTVQRLFEGGSKDAQGKAILVIICE